MGKRISSSIPRPTSKPGKTVTRDSGTLRGPSTPAPPKPKQ